MKKIYIPYIVFCIILLTLFVININSPEKQNVAQPEPEKIVTEKNKEKSKEITENEENESNYYIVKASDDIVYLYDKNYNIVDKLNIDYSNLREYDKNQFLSGIYVTTMSEVYQLLEDFSN